MSQANVELVRSLQPSGVDLVAVFEDGHLDQAGAFDASGGVFDPRFESSFIAGESAGRPRLTYRGVEGFVEGWREWLQAWDRYLVEAERFIDAGEQVVVLVRAQARTRRGGVQMQHAPAAVWTLDHGVIVRIELYLERSQALAAAGLEVREPPRDEA